MLSSLSLCNTYHPGNDFYLYVNSNWIKDNPIPDDFQRWSIFEILNENNLEKTKNLFDNKYVQEDTEFDKAKTLYYQGMNMEQRNKETPRKQVEQYLKQIDESTSKLDLMKLIILLFIKYDFSSPINFGVYMDFNDSTTNILYASSGGIGLPDRDYYFLEDKKEHRIKYKQFIKEYSSLFELDLDTESIYHLEEKLAEHMYTRVERRDPQKQNNPTNLAEFEKNYPNINLRLLFETLNVDSGKINIENPDYYLFFNHLWNELSLDTWKNFMKWKFILSVGDYLTNSTEESLFNFYVKFLSGTLKMKPLWKRVLSNVNSKLGMVVGKKFVEEFFPEESKQNCLKMVSYIKNELKHRLETNDWMDKKTRDHALIKLNKMNVKIGYPNKWRDYSLLEVDYNRSYLQNNLECERFEVEYSLSYLYKKRDNDKWSMNPHIVNAYYSPMYNEIVFPAGILQSPFFSSSYDMALNFGGIGTVIGHEMTHGFDDQGRQFDSDGNLRDWWSESVSLNYEKRTNKIKEQYEGYQIEGKFLNGKLTLGENIADLGGVSIAFQALNNYLEDNPQESYVLDGMTPKQRFFLNYAVIWRCNTRKEETLKRIITDPHSPPCYRVNGVLTNLEEFHQAFNISESNKLWKNETSRAKIW